MQLKTFSLFLVLLGAAFLAGCVEDEQPPTADSVTPGDDTTTPGDDDVIVAPQFMLTASGFPSDIHVGEAFSFTLTIEGDSEATSDHIGAHFGTTSSEEASLDFYPSACVHHEGVAPGTFTVRCTFEEEGTYHLRGHLRLAQEDDTYVHFWSAEHTLVAHEDDHDEEPTGGAASFTLTASGFPEQIKAGESFEFTLAIEGDIEATSDHIGAHYATASSTEATLTNYPHACTHQEGTAPGTFTVTCTIAEEGTYHLRGHLRLAEDDDVYVHFWTDEHTLEVGSAAAA